MNIAELQLARTPKAEILPPEEFDRRHSELRASYAPVILAGKNYAVADESSLSQAVAIGRMLQAASKDFTDFYKPIKQAHDAAKALVTDREKADLAEVKAVKDALGVQVVKYQAEQERLRQEEQRAAIAAAARREEDARLEEAMALEAMGRKAEAEEILVEQRLAPAVIVSASTPRRVAGSVTRTTWTAHVDDFGKLVKAVASGLVPILALKANESWLDKQASDYNEGLNFPGVSVSKEIKGHFRS